MKIVFFGSGKIALPSLHALIDHGQNIVGIITSPDSKKGRHLSISYTPVKEYALKKKLPILQPVELTSKESLESIKKIGADLFIVFAYGKILPKELLKIPKKFPLNIHASLLPKYRGAAPINWALINGDVTTGISIIKMSEGVDEGDIFAQKKLLIDAQDNAITLNEKLGTLGSELICDVVERIKKNNIVFKPQNPSEASYAPKLKKSDGKIDWNSDANQIRNRVRGCIPWPGAFTFFKNKTIKIWECDVLDNIPIAGLNPGEIISFNKEGIAVATEDKTVLIRELQLENAKRLGAWHFAQGHRLKQGDVFT